MVHLNNICAVVVNYIGILYGQVSIIVAKILVCTSTNLGVLTLIMIQVTLMIKGILIHKPEWLMEVSDNEVIGASWIMSFILTTIRFVIDYNLPGRPDVLYQKLIGADMKT